MSDVTPSDARNVRRVHHKVVEKTVKFRFKPMDRNDEPIHPSALHIKWLHDVQEALGSDIEIYDNKGKVLSKIDPLRWTTNLHSKVYDLHHQDGKSKNHTGRDTTVFIIHQIRTSWSLSDIKRLPTISQLLFDHKVFLTEHRWQETVWNTTQLGFIVGLDPAFFDPDQAMAKLTQDMKQSLTVRQKVPNFRMAFVTPSVKSGNNENRTKAYAIETEKSTSEECLRILKKTYKESGFFVPF
jgi:hypothetical protein